MKTPNSTYRVQLNKEFTLAYLRNIIPYLYELGISTIYASPLTQAVKGSQHGYDVSDPSAINPEIGTESDLQDISNTLTRLNMTWVQDIVPNHMAYDVCNPWIADLLERGPKSGYYRYFDLEAHARISDSHPGAPSSHPQLMLPMLGRPLEECLQDGELTLDLRKDGFVLRYFDNNYPVAPHLYKWILTAAGKFPPDLGVAIDLWEANSASPFSEWKEWKQDWIRQTLFGQESAKEENSADQPLPFVTRVLKKFRDESALARQLAESQHYLLTHYIVSNTQINYRRFFTVNSLICLRMEDEAVFDAWHKLPLSWYRKGLIHGLRIDHIDGLAAPRSYIDRLNATFGKDCYIVAEKILGPGEELPPQWKIAGTTGYEFLSDTGQVLTDAEGSRLLLTFYSDHIANMEPYEDLVFNKKNEFLGRYMQGELDNLMRRLIDLSLLNAGDEDAVNLREALGVLMASFPVYRLYPDEHFFAETAGEYMSAAFSQARMKSPGLGKEFDYLRSLFQPSPDPHIRQQQRCFLTRLMQFTGPLAAKGVEDTTFYVFNPYVSHNEVGDTPSVAGISVEDFHHRMVRRRKIMPHSLNASTTHDTKRGEDARIRLNFLSAIAQEWIAAVCRWQELNKGRVRIIDGRRAPSLNDEYLIYQALLGGLPADGIVTDEFRERFSKYLTKALQEAKTETRWDERDLHYEKACLDFASSLLEPGSDFMQDFGPFAAAVIEKSIPACLSQLLLKLTVPGVPDIYQGAETWDNSFVDPDNRRPVDFDMRRELLKSLQSEKAKGKTALSTLLSARAAEGASKLFVTQQALGLRNNKPLVFSHGEYIPVPASAQHLAFLRRYKEEWVLVIVPLIGALREAPVSVRLPDDAPRKWRNVFTGATVVGGPEPILSGDKSLLPVTLYTGVTVS